MDYFFDARFKGSRMYNEYDLDNFAKYKYFAKYRPRGVLSGLLVIKDSSSAIEFHQHNRPKINMRFRFDEKLTTKGPVVFYAYLTKKKDGSQTVVIEDLYLYENANLFQTMNFEERWKLVVSIFSSTSPKYFTQDTIISNNIKIECARYFSLADLKKSDDFDVLEMVPNNKNMKRTIILLEKEDSSKYFIAEKIVGKGPDLFFLKNEGSEEYLEKIAGIQSLEVSKALQKVGTAKVKCMFNEKFDKFVIVEVSSIITRTT